MARSPSSAQAVAAAPLKLQSPTVVIPDRRHSSAPSRAIASISSKLDPALPLDVQRDPRPEREPVAEARIGRVLEVRVRVDEAGEDHRVREVLSRAELARRPDARRCARRRRSTTAPSRIGGPSTGTTQSAERTLTRPRALAAPRPRSRPAIAAPSAPPPRSRARTAAPAGRSRRPATPGRPSGATQRRRGG